jgi:hypothetical protein
MNSLSVRLPLSSLSGNQDAGGKIQFYPLVPLTRSDLEKLIRKIVQRLLRKLGAEELPEPAEWMAALAQSLQAGSSPAETTHRGACECWPTASSRISRSAKGGAGAAPPTKPKSRSVSDNE